MRFRTTGHPAKWFLPLGVRRPAEQGGVPRIIFSHVLLESGRGGGEAPLELLQDLWESQDGPGHMSSRMDARPTDTQHLRGGLAGIL